MKLTDEQREALRKVSAGATVHGAEMIGHAHALNMYAACMTPDEFESCYREFMANWRLMENDVRQLLRVVPFPNRENHQNDFIRMVRQ